jgi:putative redox protein
MRLRRHVAHAVGSTTSADPSHRVNLDIGAHRLVAAEPVEVPGRDAGPSPFGLLAGSLAACTAATLRMYAERKEVDLDTLEVDVRCEIDDGGRVAIVRTITVPDHLRVDQVAALWRIADRSPVTVALQAGMSIETTFRSSARGDG